MKEKIFSALLLFSIVFSNHSYAQNKIDRSKIKKPSKLFRSSKILPLKISFSIKDIKKNTNDSTYIKTVISYKDKEGNWQKIDASLRRRGNFRLKKCYFPPLKIKIKKADRKGTLFKGNKQLKLVLPCMLNKEMNDYIINEFMAYKLYESISPYHFKTRIVAISFTEIKKNKTKEFQIKGILIEDISNVAKRNNGKVFKRRMNPMSQESKTSVQNAFFQYMIANTDFSTAFNHNQKLIYVDKKLRPIPYDFDMSGLVNSSYAVVSVINDKPLPISSVRERIYRGFKRDYSVIQKVRNDILNNKARLLKTVEKLQPLFKFPKNYTSSKYFINSFFGVLQNDVRFKKEIIDRLRTK